MRSKKKKLLKRILAAMLSATLISGVAVMTPVADIVGTNITAHASENIIAQGDYWKITDDDKDGKYKLTFFGTIPAYEAIYAAADAADAATSWINYGKYVTEVTTEEGAKTSADANDLFSDLYKVTSMDLSNLDTSNATNMEGMFHDCTGLTSLNLSGWDTSKVTDMYGMFDFCLNLKTIIVGNGWNTDKVTNSDTMFGGCTSLVGGKGTTFDSTKTDKTYARIDGGANAPGYFTKSPIIAQGSYWKLTDEDFDGKYKLTIFGTIPNTNGYPSNLPWYSYKDNITEITTEKGAKTSADARRLFYYFTNATSIDLSNLDTSNATNMEIMFYYCTKLTSLNLSGFDTSKVTNMYGMFYSCSKLTTITVGENWNTDKVTNSDYMFDGCTSLVGGKGTAYNAGYVDKTYARIDGSANAPGYFTQSPIIAQGSYWKVTDEDFDGNYKLTIFGTTPNTGGKAFMPPWYSYKDNITEVTTEEGAETSADASYLFGNLGKVTSMNLSCLDTSATENMYFMFTYCSSLTSLDVRDWNTSSVTNMGGMFSYCQSLTLLDLSSWDTSSVTNMGNMFYYCTSLTSLNLSGWNTSSVTYMGYMFYECTALTTITVSNKWTAENVSSTKMFYNCGKLVGGKGTTYNADIIDKTYARIDGGPSNPGYLTESGYKVTWLNEDGTELCSETVAEGKTPATPTKTDDTGKKYQYVGYKETADGDMTNGLPPAVTANATYIAVFEVVKNLLDVAEAHLSEPQYLMPGATYYLPASAGKRFSIAENSNGTTRRTPFITDSNNPFSSDNTNRISFNGVSDFIVTVSGDKLVCTNADNREQTMTADGEYDKWLIKLVSSGDYFALLAEPVNNDEEVFTVSIPQFNDEHKFMRVQYGVKGDFVGLPHYTDGWFDGIDENTNISYYNGDDDNKYAVGSDVEVTKNLTLTPFISTTTMNGTVKNYTKTHLNIRESNAEVLESGAVVDLKALAGTYILSDVELNFNGKDDMFDKITFTDSKNNTTSYEYYPKENLNFDELVITEVGQTFTLTLGEGMTATGHGTTVDGVYTDDTYGTVTIKSDKPMFTRFALTREEIIATPTHQLEEMSEEEIETAVEKTLENNENNGSMYTSPVSYKGVENGQLVYDIMLYRPTVAKISHVITTNSEFANAKTGDILFPSESIDLTENGQYDVSASFDKSYVEIKDKFKDLVDNTVDDPYNLSSGGGITGAQTVDKGGVITGKYATYESFPPVETDGVFTPALGIDPETGNTIFGNAWVITGISDLEIAFEKYEMPVIGQTKQKVFSLESAKVDFRNISECEIIVISNETDTPEIIVSYDGTVVSPENYSVSSSDVENGVGTVTISGKGLYIGSVEKTFAVLSKKVSVDVTRKKTSTGARVTLSGEWLIPEGAEILESGVARVHVSDPEGITKEYIYEHGIKKSPGIQYRNVKMAFSINLNKTAAQKKICAVTYVKYKIGDKEFTSISDVKFA